jgi:hypothetical protein
MIRHPARLSAVLTSAASVGLLLAAAPAGAAVPQPPSPVSLTIVYPCPINWTNVIIGTDQDDDIAGTPGNDLILGLGGDDVIYGDAGQDTIVGGNGDDTLAGAQDDDCILGGAGADESVLFYYTVPNGSDDSYSVAYRYQY